MTDPSRDEDSGLPVTSDDSAALGKVAAPPDKESTSDVFYFWTERDKVVERTQVVYTECRLGDRPVPVQFVGLVEEVYRQSRQRDMGEEVDRHDGKVREKPPFRSEGFTYAKTVILRTHPVTHAPPLEECTVWLGGAAEAQQGYGIDRMRAENKLAVGRLRNGGTKFAGPAVIDLAYLLGENGGHLNVNGIAGLGAKTSFLLLVNYLLMRWAQQAGSPGDPGRIQVVPIIFNVKNYDLFFIDRWNKNWRDEHRDDWEVLGVTKPEPFRDVRFLAPQLKGSENPMNVGRTDAKKVAPYSWGLADVIEHNLFRYLFADDDINDPSFGALVGAIEEWLSKDAHGQPKLKADVPQTFQALLNDLQTVDKNQIGDPHPSTKGKLLRRLRGLIQDGDGVLRRDQPRGQPLVMPDAEVAGPLVIDLYGISRTPALQRFVVAAVFHQLVEKRSGNTVEGLRYLVTLDELNRFAPRRSGSPDPITEKIEQVASEMRSQGIILLGAQQQASLVSPRVIENAGIRAIGRSGTLELSADVWKFLSPAARAQAAQIMEDEKLLVQASFRALMLAKIPFPPWALRKEEVAIDRPVAAGTASTSVTPARRERHGQDLA